MDRKLDTKDYAIMGLCTALIAICAWITIPAAVPFTMQTFAVFLTAGLLGGKRGTIVVLVYLLLGAVGLPVFSGFAGGLGYMMGVTGGYLVGFIFIGLIMWLFEKLWGFSRKTLIISMILGLIACYAFGTAWFIIVYTKNTGSIGVLSALSMCVFPYIIPDAAKIMLATLLTMRLRKVIQ